MFASVQLQDDASADDVSEGVVIEEDSNEIVVYEEDDDDDDSFTGMQFVTEQIVTKQLMSTRNMAIDCEYYVTWHYFHSPYHTDSVC